MVSHDVGVPASFQHENFLLKGGNVIIRLHLHHLQSHQVLRHLVASLVKGKLAIRQAP